MKWPMRASSKPVLRLEFCKLAVRIELHFLLDL